MGLRLGAAILHGASNCGSIHANRAKVRASTVPDDAAVVENLLKLACQGCPVRRKISHFSKKTRRSTRIAITKNGIRPA